VPQTRPSRVGRSERAPVQGPPGKRSVPFALAQRALLISMIGAIAIVAGLAWWDERREARSALLDLESEQTTLASSLAAGLRAELATVERDAELIGEFNLRYRETRYDPVLIRAAGAPRASTSDPSRLLLSVPLANGQVVDLGARTGELLNPGQRLPRAGELAFFTIPPGDLRLRGVDGLVLASPPIRAGLYRGLPAVRLEPDQAAQIGLQDRTAMAGLARVDGGVLGSWSVVAVASAARERDREKRALWRLMSSVLVASSLVASFGGLAVRTQRKELDFARELTVAAIERDRDEKLRRAERAATTGAFAMGIAHEVATPLGVIVGRAEQLLAGSGADERATRCAQAILRQADGIQEIVRRFLDMARGGRPAFEKIDAAAVARAAAAALEHRFAKANVTLVVNLPASRPLILCDRNLLEQAIINLLLNACQACLPGGRVELTAHYGAERVEFAVSDDGVGISPDDAARANEPFFTTKRSRGGTGLGLAIATEIAKSHGGDLTIVANADRGTRACIEIPVAATGVPQA
jgi:two-component system, NtrC family, sensor kinase